MRRPKPRATPVRGKTPIPGRTRCTRTQPSKRRVTRRTTPVQTLTGITQSASFGAAIATPADVQPLRTLAEFARSIFEAARELLEEGGDLVKS
jgi:hypothetical protein